MNMLLTRRQVVALFAAGAASLILSGCTSQTDASRTADTSPETTSSTTNPAGNVLVVYYSLPEATSVADMTREGKNSTVTINGEVLGNVQYLAQLIAEQTDGKLVRVEAVDPYPVEDHQALIDQAKDELDSNFRPEITGAPTREQIEAANTIFIGYPIWWSDLPTPVYSLLESIDLSGKTVIPFTCHGGSGFSSTRSTLAELQPNATIRSADGFSVSRDVVAESADDVTEWLEGLGLVK